jgi:hypothetical protein
MSHSYEFDLVRYFPKNYIERKSAENSPASTEIEYRELFCMSTDSRNCPIQFIQKQLRRPRAALRVPFGRGCSFFERIGMNGCQSPAQCRSLLRSKRRASSHGIMLTAPLSI